MLLYHGTDTRVVARILSEGIRPQPASGGGNWPTAPSKAGFVYLTSAFAPYYAMVSVFNPKPRRGVNPVIFEVDLDVVGETRLYPDEDFTEQRIRASKKAGQNIPSGWSLDVHASQDQWQASLDGLGTVGVYGGVPPEALTRYAVIDMGFNGKQMTKCPNLYDLFTAQEQSGPAWTRVSLARYSQERDELHNLVAFIFGDKLFRGKPRMGYRDSIKSFRRLIAGERQAGVTVHQLRQPSL